MIRIEPSGDRVGAQAMLDRIDHSETHSWLVATSVNAITMWAAVVGLDTLKDSITRASDLRFAAIGDATREALVAFGARDVVVPPVADAATLAHALIDGYEPGLAIVPRGSLARPTLIDALSEAGWAIESSVVYRTDVADPDPSIVTRLLAGGFAAVVVRSPSAATALARWGALASAPIVCSGQVTATAVKDLGSTVAAISESPRPSDVAKAVARLLGVVR
ncbi:MAG: hypothetical protein B7C54_01855 [Acidimicrobiales bacterium mtb01]|nr:uroporphyrinogen-III synthase [Actinomycetota bacterium]TEX47832.1 MAG: hypothetical protein B7C54_01855 [Acidimicrobiales bacterium mtb01]